MSIFSIIAVGIVAAILCVLLRQVRPEYAVIVSLATGIFFFLAVFSDVLGVVERIRGLLERASIPTEYAEVLIKALGICFVTQIACDVCRDAGETAIASKLEMAGRVIVLIVSLPLFEQVLSVVYSLIASGA